MTDEHLDHLAAVDGEFRAARDCYRDVSARRNDAMVAAYESGVRINEIADLLRVGHESVRKVIRAAGR